MRILWISAKNFKCYNEIQIPIEGIFPKGLFFVEGENSTGKSSLFDAIHYAFFYDPTTAKELGNKDDLIKRGKGETEVEVAFKLDNKCYIIKREHSRKSSVMAYLLEIDQKKAMEGQTAGSVKICEGVVDVKTKLEELLNINREKALSTLIVRQGAVQSLAEAKGADLRDIIYELFQLDYYREKTIDIVKKRRSILDDEKEKNKIVRETENIKEEIEEINIEITNTHELIKETENRILESESELEKFPAIIELQELSALINKLEGEKSSLEIKEDILKKITEELSLKYPIEEIHIKKKIKDLDEKSVSLQNKQQQMRNKISELREKKAFIEREREIFSERKKSLESISLESGEKPTCEVCSQEIDSEKFQELLRISEENIPILTKAIAKKIDEINENEKIDGNLSIEMQDLFRSKTKIENISRDLSEIKILKKTIDNSKEKIGEKLKKYKVESLTELSKEFGLDDFDDFYNHVNELERIKNSDENERKNLLKSIQEKSSKILKLNKQIADNKEKEIKNEQLDYQIALIQAVQKYVEGFIAEELISNKMLANIQQSTSGYIFLFTRGKYSELYLEPTKQKTLNMTIKDEELGFIKNQNLLSGGDKAAIGLGLRLGIGELLKRVRPLKSSPYQAPKMDILVLDEPLGSLDEERRSKVIEGLVAEKKFSQIFLITHTNIRKRFRAPLISIQSSQSGSRALYYPETTEVEEEAEE